MPFLKITPDHGPNYKMIGKNQSDSSSIFYAFEILNPDFDLKKSEKLIDESIALFDQLIVKVNTRDNSEAKLTFRNIRQI